MNYKYRMHDPRIGRFFAIDPLAPKYPHNSPYAFSENVVINAIELEGAEFFYDPQGNSIGQVKGRTDIKVISSAYLESNGGIEGTKKLIVQLNGMESAKAIKENVNFQHLVKFENSKSFPDYFHINEGAAMSQEEYAAYSNILTDIYEIANGKGSMSRTRSGQLGIIKSGRIVYGPQLRTDKEGVPEHEYRNNLLYVQGRVAGVSANLINLDGNLYLFHPMNGKMWFYDYALSFVHENEHISGNKSSGDWDEFDCNFDIMSHSWFKLTSPLFKSDNFERTVDYLISQYRWLQSDEGKSSANYENYKDRFKKNHKEYEKKYEEVYGKGEKDKRLENNNVSTDF